VAEFVEKGNLVVYTKDYHPADHVSFKVNDPQGLWPPHCVQDTWGGEYHPALDVRGQTFLKAFLSDQDSYSAFGGHIEADPGAQSLSAYLRAQGVAEVTVVGLALDYCVKSTAIDAHNLGLKSTVLLDATRAVNVNPDDGDKAVEEMKGLGIVIQ
jgi:nicotinamidase/pyrazinamidase